MMTPEQFIYWLQGYSEVSGRRPTKEQWAIIQDHLNLVFDKQTPDYDPAPDPNPPFTPRPVVPLEPHPSTRPGWQDPLLTATGPQTPTPHTTVIC